MLQEVFGSRSLLAAFLDAFFVVDIHVEVGAVIQCHGNAFIVDHLNVLDRGSPREDGILDSLGRVRVDCHRQAEVAGFIHRRLQFFQREFERVGIAAVSEDRAGGKDFDKVHTVVGQLADSLAHFPGAVGFSVVQIPGQLNVGSLAGHRSRAARNRDVSPRDVHTWARHISASDGVAQGYVVQRTIGTHITNGCEARLKHLLGVGHRFEHNLGGRFPQNVKWLAVAVTVRDVGVAINQAGEDGHTREIDDVGSGWNGQPFADGFNFVLVDQNDLVGENRARVRIHETPRFDCRHLGRGAIHAQQPENNREEMSRFHRISLCKRRRRANAPLKIYPAELRKISIRGNRPLRQAVLQVRRQQTMEQLLACLTTYGEAPSAVGSRLESALNVLTDTQVFALDSITNRDALRVVFPTEIADVAEVEVENYSAMVDVQRQHQVGVHVTRVTVDHEVGILPEVPSAIAFASSAGSSVFIGGHHRARLQAVPVFVFDGVLLVIENAAEGLVQVRNVVATIKIIVDEDLPVACNVVDLAVKEVQLAKAERLAALHQSTQETAQWFGLWIEVDEDKRFPGFHLYRKQSVFLAVKVLHALELRHSLQRAVQTVIPPVIWTMEDRGTAAWFRDHFGSVVTTYIVEGPQLPVCSTHRHDRFARQRGGDELTRFFHLVCAADRLPGLAEDDQVFQFCDPRIDVPRRGNRGRF